jgi:hypothetical protein
MRRGLVRLLRVMLLSEDPGADYDRPLPDPEATDAISAPRDPSGVLRRQLEANGALTDGILDLRESQQLLFSVLQAQGNSVSLDVMPDSFHEVLNGKGWGAAHQPRKHRPCPGLHRRAED